MAFQRSGDRRSSERDAALVQLQLAAQARNRRWYDFLCAKRDELQARLRQQGYSSKPQPGGQLAGGSAQNVEPVDQPEAQWVARSPETSDGWGAAPPEETEAPPITVDVPVDIDEIPTVEAHAQGTDLSTWWGERDVDQA